MKTCDKHWGMMREAVEARGLSHLIKSAEENIEASIDQVNEVRGPVAAEYDPLMAMYWMVMGRAIELGGLYLMSPHPDTGQDYCPVCEAMNHLTGVPGLFIDGEEVESTSENVEKHWIDGPADAVHERCVELGLVTKS